MYIIYIIHTPNLGREIAVLGRKREQCRFRESSEGARRRSGGASREHFKAAQGPILGTVSQTSPGKPHQEDRLSI